MTDQMHLFGAPPPPTKGPPEGVVTDEDRALAAALPDWLRLGTSSWSFQGWEGIVYDRKASPQVLSRQGLRAYAQNPLFRTVGVDRAHYQPLTVEQWRHHADQVPADFRFLVKAHEWCTLARFPSHARYGARADQDNGFFLDPLYARDEVIGPTVEGLADKLGVLLFQFAAQDLRRVGGPDGFCDALYAFLSALPVGPTYAVEVRNARLLTPRFADALAASGAMPCLARVGDLPDLREQARRTPFGIAPVGVLRWMLKRGHTYDTAARAYAPFSELRDPDPATREVLASLVAQLPRPTFVIMNNKAEGCSPESIRAFARRLVEMFHVEQPS